MPPDLVIAEPVIPPLLKPAQPSVRVAVKGQASAGATVRINGDQTTLSRGVSTAVFEQVVPVTSGQRQLVIEATNEKGSSRKVIIPVYSTLSASRTGFAGQKYAVVIGVSDFGSSKEAPPRLPVAAGEVQELAGRLESQAGFKRENIRLLVNEKATLDMVRIALSDFAAKARSNDLLVIHIATHGLHDPRVGRGDKMYLALHGTQLSTLDSTALAFSDLEILLNRGIRTNQCFLVFDVSHDLNEEWRFRAGRNLVNNHILNLFGDKAGWSILVSGSSDQISRGLGHGVQAAGLFGHWLSAGLGGAADLNGDHVVTASELFSFVSQKVKIESQGAQQPRFRLPAASADQPLGLR